MVTWATILAGLCAYLLGSIPFGYLLYRLGRNEDIRETGSGNIGATNVLRVAGPLAGAATLLLDAGKGYVAASLAGRTTGSSIAIAACALLVIVGHCYPVFLGFRGGKGVATALGAFLAISPMAVFVCAAFFAASVLVFGYVSLASILAAAAFPLALHWSGDYPAVYLVAAVAASGLIIFRHRDNIHRLRTGTENRIWLRRTPR
jgi:glycerol-3-phosphate acyltransferase PlsY